MMAQPIPAVRSSKAHEVSWIAFVPLALAILMFVGLGVYSVVRPVGPTPRGPVGPGSPGALVWSNGIFSDRPEMRSWLHFHGVTYKAFAKHHPQAHAFLPPKSRPLPKKRSRLVTKPKPVAR
jgi:hypothetical protein